MSRRPGSSEDQNPTAQVPAKSAGAQKEMLDLQNRQREFRAGAEARYRDRVAESAMNEEIMGYFSESSEDVLSGIPIPDAAKKAIRKPEPQEVVNLDVDGYDFLRNIKLPEQAARYDDGGLGVIKDLPSVPTNPVDIHGYATYKDTISSLPSVPTHKVVAPKKPVMKTPAAHQGVRQAWGAGGAPSAGGKGGRVAPSADYREDAAFETGLKRNLGAAAGHLRRSVATEKKGAAAVGKFGQQMDRVDMAGDIMGAAMDRVGGVRSNEEYHPGLSLSRNPDGGVPLGSTAPGRVPPSDSKDMVALGSTATNQPKQSGARAVSHPAAVRPQQTKPSSAPRRGGIFNKFITTCLPFLGGKGGKDGNTR